MLVELKRVLDKYTEEELKDMNLWVDANTEIKMICIEKQAITLISEDGADSLEINGNSW